MRSLGVIMVVGIMLAACGGAPPPVTAVEQSAIPPAETPAPTASLACTQVVTDPTPDPAGESLFPPVSADDYTIGSSDAPATITLYSDFQCAGCAELAASLKELVEASEGGVRVAFRPFPMASVNDKALLAAQAADAAGEQDKFWEMHDYLFETQADWNGLQQAEFETWLLENAIPDLDLDADEFSAALDREDIVARAQSAWEFGRDTGLPGAPFLFINGQIYTGPKDYDNLSRIASLLALAERQVKTCPDQVIDPAKQYTATLHTEKGDIVLALFADKAPVTVNSFVFLAQQGWFDDITFHRVIPGFVAQTGDPSGTGMGSPGYYIKNENDPTLTYDREGLVGMANSGPDTNGSQFFITLGPAPHLNGQYTIFGEVLEGMDVVKSLTERDPLPGATLPPGDRLLSITIAEE